MFILCNGMAFQSIHFHNWNPWELRAYYLCYGFVDYFMSHESLQVYINWFVLLIKVTYCKQDYTKKKGKGVSNKVQILEADAFDHSNPDHKAKKSEAKSDDIAIGQDLIVTNEIDVDPCTNKKWCEAIRGWIRSGVFYSGKINQDAYSDAHSVVNSMFLFTYLSFLILWPRFWSGESH